MKPPLPANPEPKPPDGKFSQSLSRGLAYLRVEEVPHIKRVIVTVVGGTVLIFGVALIFLPGPSVLVIPAGLAILGTEYAWARMWLRKGRSLADKALSRTQRIVNRRKPASAAAQSASDTADD